MTDTPRSRGNYLAPALVACAAAVAPAATPAATAPRASAAAHSTAAALATPPVSPSGSAAGVIPGAGALTIDRLFDAPALSGPAITSVKIVPDGTRVTYLRGKPEDKNRLDLWMYDVRSGQSRLLVDSDLLAPPARAAQLSEEELGRRERQRTAALSGILDYQFAPSGRALLIPMNGRLYYVDLQPAAAAATPAAAAATPAVPRLLPPAGFVTDASISPAGGAIAYVRDQNLYVYDLLHDAETPLTHDGGGAIKNGMAEFVAQEEMDRGTGYWWSPDGSRVAYARIDETSIPEVQRFEIAADQVTTTAQRYPTAGGPNVRVRLAVANVRGAAAVWIDLGSEEDIYLARVNWLPDGKTLAVQRQSRDQRRLDLLFADVATGRTRLVLTETSDSWIGLNDELGFLKHSKEFIWASSRDGFEHLYLYDLTGRLVRRLTAGAWNVNDFRARAVKWIDEKHRRIYFVANAASPISRQLYVTSLDTAEPTAVRRLSQGDGLHAVLIAPGAAYYVDQFQSRLQPPQVALHRIDGTRLAFIVENRLDASHPDAPYLADNAVAEFGTLAAADGQTLYYRLFKPPHFDPAKRHPAIVEVYGGPGVQQVVDNWAGASFTQILTRAGYVVFQLDNRGSGFRGTAFEAPIRGRLGEVEVADQVRGAQWLAGQPFVDPARIGVWGWSYGGYMTLMLMFKAPELFHAGVSGAPVTDFSLYDTHYTERYLGRPQDNRAGYAASAVFPSADGLRGKLLVMHGMADDNVLFVNSTQLFRRLQDLGKPFDVMVYPGAKHGLLRQHDGRHAYAMIEAYFDRNLPP